MNDFTYASGYYPYVMSKDQWRKDLSTLKSMDIKVLRTAELFGAWDIIEGVEGQYNFEILDEFMDLCLEFGIQVMLGTGTASPPLWISQKHPEVNITNNMGKQYPNNVSYSWACVDHVDYRTYAERFIRVLVERYKGHPALCSYQIHNEISFPFMPLESGGVEYYCYCEHSVKNFQKWAKKKYKNIDALNYAYRWGPSFTVLQSFDQLMPPKARASAWASVTRWLDWRLFWMDNLVQFIKWQNEIIKSIDRKHVTTTNIFFLKSQDPLGVITALDQFEMAKVVDIVGYDLYPSSGDKLEKMYEFSTMFLDMARSTSRPLGKNYWLLETEAGPINDWILGPSKNVQASDIYRNIFEAISFDSKLTLYQVYREPLFQPLYWGGLVDLMGNENHLTQPARDIGKLVDGLSAFIGEANNKSAEIAIHMDKTNAIALNAMEQDGFLLKALRGFYRCITDKNYDVEFITNEHLENGYADRFKLIVAPFMCVVNAKTAVAVKDYVKQGGHYIATAKFSVLGEHAWYNDYYPAFELSEVFGFRAKMAEVCKHPNVTYRNKTQKGHWHKEYLEVSENAEICARFGDDTPAVIKNQYGDGSTVYFATHPDVAYLEGSYLLFDYLDDYLQELGITPQVKLDYAGRINREIRAKSLTNGKQELVVITQYVQNDYKDFFVGKKKLVSVRVEGRYEQVKNYLVDEIIESRQEEGYTYFDVEVLEDRVLLVMMQ